MPPRRRVRTQPDKPYDAAMKELVGLDPATWLRQFGVPPTGPVTIVPTDLAGTILMEADQILRIGGALPWLVHIEFQASRDRRMGTRLHLYSTLLGRRHHLPVKSVLILLRPEADVPGFDGRHILHLPDGEMYLTFHYHVVRIWQQPLETLLTGPLATLPLAPLVGVSDADVSNVLRRLEARVREEATPSRAEQLRVGTYLLLGLRFPQDVIDDLLRGVGIMAGALKESSTYQKILREGLAEGRALGRAEGRAEGAQAMLLRIGTRRLGPPPSAIRAMVERLNDAERLEGLIERAMDATSWDDLGLGGPEA